MSVKKLRLALIGCGGNMRGAHVPRIREDGHADIVAVADAEKTQADALMEHWG
jgi:predicted dehydrogenase